MAQHDKIRKGVAAFHGRTREHSDPLLLLLLGTSFLIAMLLFPHLLIPTQQYQVGDVVQKDIKAPRDFLVEDKEATRKKRLEAAESVLTVYDFDDQLAAKLSEKVTEAFSHVRDLTAAVEPPAAEVFAGGGTPNDVAIPGPDTHPSAAGPAIQDSLVEARDDLQHILGIQVSDEAFAALKKAAFSESLANQIGLLLQNVLQNGIVANKELLLQAKDKGIILRRLSSRQERPVKNLQRFLSPEEARTAATNFGDDLFKDTNRNVHSVIVEVAAGLLQPNLTLNKGETEERKKIASEEVKAVLSQVKEGEMLLREGTRVTEADMVKLKALTHEMGRQPLLTSGLGFMLLTIVFLIILFNVTYSDHHTRVVTNKDLVFLCVMFVVLFFLSRVSASLAEAVAVSIPYSVQASSLFYAIPVATGSMVVCLFMGLGTAVPFALAMAFLVAFLFENRFDMFLFFLLSGIVGAFWTRSCRERGTLIKAGLKVGLVNMLLVTAFQTFKGVGLEFRVLWDWGFSFIGGLSAGILAAGLAPLVEMIFGYTTDIKLLELANLDRPILRKLMLEAPGTYHHSVIVGSLVEVAAAQIGANPLLAKVSGYYHDLGKIKKPLYFIENQAGGENKHNKLAPSMSSLILTAHVKDGVEIAKNHRLGRPIIDIIQQHHGTSLITYFFEKARKLKGKDAINIEHFRYPGPKPQTKEAGLVMLADAVEAASRSLENPTPARVKGLVQKIINKIFLDGQLDECELTLRDLHEIASSFNKILNGIYHHRIEYPQEEATQGNGNGKLNADSNRRQAKSLSDGPREDQGEGTNHLRRLGMS